MRYIKIPIDQTRCDELEKMTYNLAGYKDLLSTMSEDNEIRNQYFNDYMELVNKYEILKRRTTTEYVEPELDENEEANWKLNFDTSTLEVEIKDKEYN